jgi:hypothetical protein
MKPIKIIVLILSSILLSSELFAQNTFIRYYPHGRNVAGFALNEHPNGDISFMAKFSEFSGIGLTGVDFGIHRINGIGNTVDSFYFAKQGDDYTEDFTIKNNSCYFTGVYFQDYQHQENGREIFYKVTSIGDTVCKTVFNTNGNSYGRKILERNNLFYLIGEEVDTNGTLNLTLKVVDSNGFIINNNSYGGIRQEWGYDGIFTKDKGLVLAGHRYNSPSLGNAQIYIVKTDSLGIVQWSSTIQKPLDSLFDCDHRTTGIIQAANGDYFVVGYQTKCSFDLKKRSFLVCLDSIGNTKWFKTSPYFKGDNNVYDESIQAIALAKDGNIVCLGGRYAENPGQTDYQYDVFLIKFDLNGNKIWSRQYGTIEYYETPYDMIATSDGGYAISGRYAPYDIVQMNIEGIKTLIIKTDACGCVVPGCDPNCNATGIEKIINNKQITLHPNPSNTIVTVSGVDEPIKVSLYSLEGKLLKEIYHSSTMDVSDILPGMYIVRVTDKNHNAYYFGKLRIGE